MNEGYEGGGSVGMPRFRLPTEAYNAFGTYGIWNEMAQIYDLSIVEGETPEERAARAEYARSTVRSETYVLVDKVESKDSSRDARPKPCKCACGNETFRVDWGDYPYTGGYCYITCDQCGNGKLLIDDYA